MSDAFIKFTEGPREGHNFELSRTKEILIGRKRGDLILNDPLVSGTHARIFAKEDGWYIQDLNSTNGTVVDGNFIVQERLRPGAEITIGSHIMVLFVEVEGNRDDRRSYQSSKSRLERAWLLDEELLSIQDSATFKPKDLIDRGLRFPPSFQAKVSVVSGVDLGKDFSLSTGHVTIGRGLGEIPLMDAEVSRNHASISFFGRQMIFLQDLESTNGTFHNNRKISASLLRHGDTIGIGRTVLCLHVQEH